MKQLNKLIDVVKLIDISGSEHIERELVLAKVRAVGAMRDEVQRLSSIFRGRILDVTSSSYVLEITGDRRKIDAFLDAVGQEALIEVVRSGTTGMLRGERALTI
jgi:acetolactate synthase-1/3 small subunit